MKTNLFFSAVVAMAAPSVAHAQQLFDKITMAIVAVDDMEKAKDFYAGKLGFTVVTDYGSGDRRWVTVVPPGGGTRITLSTYHGNLKPGTTQLYLSTSDIQAAYRNLSAKGAAPTEIKDDLYGPGSGVKWCSAQDPDGNTWIVWQEAKQ